MPTARAALAASLIGVLAAASCSTAEPDAAPIGDSLFVEILVDLHLAGVRPDNALGTAESMIDSILAEHGVGTVLYDSAVVYYARHPDA